MHSFYFCFEEQKLKYTKEKNTKIYADAYVRARINSNLKNSTKAHIYVTNF